jgi:TetR/AcrR family transcriptional regulator
MGVTERKEKEKQQRIELILKAAEKVFIIKGMEHATMSDVAELAELGKGTLYLYFTSKDDILFALTGKAIEELHKEFVKASAKPKTAIDKLRALGMAYMDYCGKNPLKYQLINFYRVQPVKPEHEKEIPNFFKCHEVSQKLFELMVQIIVKGQADKTISKHVDPFQTALVLWGTSTGIYQLMHTMGEHLEEDHGIPPKQMADLYFKIIENSLKNFK